MRSLTRFNSISLGISTLLVFLFWAIINEVKNISPLWIIISGFFLSLGVYRTIVIILNSLLKKSELFKKYILGPYFLNGTWVGFYIGFSGDVRYLVEKFEQELDGLNISGKSFDNNLKYHSTWNSDTINIDIKKGKLTYMYEVSGLDNISNNVGIAIFNFERKSQYNPPYKLVGYSSDLHLTKKVKAMEIKINGLNLSDAELLNVAKELYESNKSMF